MIRNFFKAEKVGVRGTSPQARHRQGLSSASARSACAGISLLLALGACGDDDEGTKTDEAGIGATLDGAVPGAPGQPDGAPVNTPTNPPTGSVPGSDGAVSPSIDGGVVVGTDGAVAPPLPDPVPPPLPVNAVYGVAGQVLGDEASTTYVSTLRTLDKPTVDRKQAIELGGRSTIGTVGNWLFIGEEESPVIRRFTVAADGKLTEETAKRLSFANEGLASASVDDWGNTFISPTKAYLHDTTNGGEIIWNPTTMEITGHIEVQGFERPGLDPDGSPGFVRGNRLFRTLSWKNWDEFSSSSEQYVLVYDTDNDKLLTMVPETRCPALSAQITTDEQGTLYLSNYIYNVAETLVRKAPKSCSVRILPGAEAPDPSWVLTHSDLTGGKEAAGLAYTKNGKALLSVFDATGLTLDATTDISDLVSETRWELYTVDLAARTATKLDGTPRFAGGLTQSAIDGRNFAFFVSDDYASTTIWEVTGGVPAVKSFEIDGFAYQLLRLR